MATACFGGFPAAISRLTFDLNACFEVDLVSGMICTYCRHFLRLALGFTVYALILIFGGAFDLALTTGFLLAFSVGFGGADGGKSNGCSDTGATITTGVGSKETC